MIGWGVALVDKVWHTREYPMKMTLLGAHISRFLAILLGIAIMLVSVLSISASPKAAEPLGPVVMYYLPYPGILPDNPLYKIKAMRDQLRLWITFDPVKKAERQLLYADKRINAAKALNEGGKQALAISTATKAEKYLERSVNLTLQLLKSGTDVKSLLLTQAKSTAKHHEILVTFEPPLEMAIKTNELLSQQISQALLEN